MNVSKSRVYFLHSNKRLKETIIKILGFKEGSFPIQYLGVSLFTRHMDYKFWEGIIGKIRSKASSWKNHWLSQAGRIIMIKSVLSTIPIYHMSVYNISKRISSVIDGLFKKNL